MRELKDYEIELVKIYNKQGLSIDEMVELLNIPAGGVRKILGVKNSMDNDLRTLNKFKRPQYTWIKK